MAELLTTRGPQGFPRWLWLSGRLVRTDREDRAELRLRATASTGLTELVAAEPSDGGPERLVLWDGGARSVGFDGRLRVQTRRYDLGDHGTDVLLRRPGLALDDRYVEVLERDGGERVERMVLGPRPVEVVEDPEGHGWPGDQVGHPWTLRAPALVVLGADRYEVVVDHLHGVITACHGWAGSERVGGTELLDLRFDHDLEPPDITVPGPIELPAWTGWQELAVAQQAADAVQLAWLRHTDADDAWPELDELVCEAVAPPGTVALRLRVGGRETTATVAVDPGETAVGLERRLRARLAEEAASA